MELHSLDRSCSSLKWHFPCPVPCFQFIVEGPRSNNSSKDLGVKWRRTWSNSSSKSIPQVLGIIQLPLSIVLRQVNLLCVTGYSYLKVIHNSNIHFSNNFLQQKRRKEESKLNNQKVFVLLCCIAPVSVSEILLLCLCATARTLSVSQRPVLYKCDLQCPAIEKWWDFKGVEPSGQSFGPWLFPFKGIINSWSLTLLPFLGHKKQCFCHESCLSKGPKRSDKLLIVTSKTICW